MGADFLVLIKGKERDAYSAVLGQGFADNLAWLGDYLAAQGQRLFVGNVFNIRILHRGLLSNPESVRLWKL